MRVAIYARVSTQHQMQTQTIEQQLERLRAYVKQQGWNCCKKISIEMMGSVVRI